MKPALTVLFLGLLSTTAASATASSITFYQNDNFGGRQFVADRPVENLSRNGFNDRIHSAVVHDGRWEICIDADFNGSCSILVPGDYPTLGAYAGRISSARPLDRSYSSNRLHDRGRSREAQATLFEKQNLSGRSFSLNSTMPNLDPTGFNDRASSLRVESGYWIFCSDAHFQGECRTFGPGEYASLPGMNNEISSGRRIANDYPYDARPEWQRDSQRQSQHNQSYR